MLLRVLTTFFLLFGIILALAFPWVLRTRPLNPTRVELQRYTVFFGTYLTVDMLAFVGAAICAVLMLRQVRHSYRQQSRQNLEELIESALQQHRKPEAKDES